LLLWKTFKTIRKEKRLRITACCEGKRYFRRKIKRSSPSTTPFGKKNLFGIAE
jgi:hypothetical protein